MPANLPVANAGRDSYWVPNRRRQQEAHSDAGGYDQLPTTFVNRSAGENRGSAFGCITGFNDGPTHT